MRADWMTTTTASLPFAELERHTVTSLLDKHAVLEIAGPDSSKFLQGQLTCNLQDISLAQSRPGAHCTHQGRMVANFRLLQVDATRYLFVLPADTLPLLQAALAKYIVFSKAKLRDASDDFVLLGVSGPQASASVQHVFGAVPDAVHTQVQNGNGSVVCIDAGMPRYLCLLNASTAQAQWPALTGDRLVVDSHYWHWLNIRTGIGDVRAQTSGQFIPQMLNMQLLDGISFTKGCYTGQEIVARMQYRGTLKKSMQRIAGEGTVPSPNDALRHVGAEQAAGHVVMAEAAGENRWEGLAVLPHDDNTPLLTADGTPVERLSD